jgi:hypothetical protein
VEISDDEDDREKIKTDLFGVSSIGWESCIIFAQGDYDDDEAEQRPQRSRSASVSSRESYEDGKNFVINSDLSEFQTIVSLFTTMKSKQDIGATIGQSRIERMFKILRFLLTFHF